MLRTTHIRTLALAAVVAGSTIGVAAPAAAQTPVEDAALLAECLTDAVAGGVDPALYNIVLGTATNDTFFEQATAGPDLFCGGDGQDVAVGGAFRADDVFVGGDGHDTITRSNTGTARNVESMP